jgi:hypothetical protein
MSYPLMGAVCEADQIQIDRGLLAVDRHVFLRLANRMNHLDGRCDPVHATLAKDTGLSVRTIGEATRALWLCHPCFSPVPNSVGSRNGNGRKAMNHMHAVACQGR